MEESDAERLRRLESWYNEQLQLMSEAERQRLAAVPVLEYEPPRKERSWCWEGFLRHAGMGVGGVLLAAGVSGGFPDVAALGAAAVVLSLPLGRWLKR
jgi:hypothetical protein